MKNKKISKEKKFIYSLTILSFFIFFLYAYIIPFGSAPDEILRYDLIDFLVKYKELPVAGDQRLFYGEYGATYATTPYLSSMISAVFVLIGRVLSLPFKDYLMARMVSVLSGVGAVYFLSLISIKIFKNSILRYFTPLLLISIPQFSYICGYVNQDSFTIFLSAMIIYQWVSGAESNWAYKNVVYTGIILGLILLSYLNGYVLILGTFFVVMLTYKDKNNKEFYKKFLLCVTIMLVVSGWFFVRNAIIYNGDFLGINVNAKLSEVLAIDELKPSNRNTFIKQGKGFNDLIIDSDWIQKTFKSSWAYFDHMLILVKNKFYYTLMLAITILGFGGVNYKIIDCIKRKKLKNNSVYIFGVCGITILISLGLSMYFSIYRDWQPQGRYWFPSLIPAVILMAYGIDQWIPIKVKSVFYKIFYIAMISINLYISLNTLFFYYYV